VHYHTVLFQFSDDTSQDEIDDVLDRLRGLAAIPAVRSIAVGLNSMPVVDGWTHGMTMVFDSQTSMMADFAPHPLHEAVVRDQVPVFERYMAMDVSSGLDKIGNGDDDETGR
jgi:Stress responsive A/B Barrel Domain